MCRPSDWELARGTYSSYMGWCTGLRTAPKNVREAAVTGIRNTFSANVGQGQVGEPLWIKWEAALQFRMVSLIVEAPEYFLAVAFGVCGMSNVHVNGFADFDVKVVGLLIVGDGRDVFKDFLVQLDVDVDVSGLLEIGTQIQQCVARVRTGESTTEKH
ncbi:hypothetical protein K438DRAFT_1790352 [Mycena galopus ATCC 62051]|nr:hypothetical protein K438DRAFT_1790352 [Mycena galopus ATCC 62051]